MNRTRQTEIPDFAFRVGMFGNVKRIEVESKETKTKNTEIEGEKKGNNNSFQCVEIVTHTNKTLKRKKNQDRIRKMDQSIFNGRLKWRQQTQGEDGMVFG